MGGCGISAARFVEPCGNPRWNFAATVVGTSWKSAANVIGKIVGRCGINAATFVWKIVGTCGNGRWRVVDQPLTPVRGQASLPFSWARHLRRVPAFVPVCGTFPHPIGDQPGEHFAEHLAAQNCEQPDGVGSGGVWTAAVSFGRAARRTRCERLPDAFSQGLVSYPIFLFLAVTLWRPSGGFGRRFLARG